MSNPRNPITKYASHQYHFLLLASNQTEAIRNIMLKMKDKNYFHKLKSLQDFDMIEDSGVICVHNSNVSTNYFIDEVNITTFPVNAEGPGTITAATDIEMTIIENNGIYFLDFLRTTLEEKLESGFAGSVFTLIPFFVGYHGKTFDAIDVIPNRIFNMIINTIGCSFNENGGTYNISFTDIANGVGLLNGNFGFINKNVNISAKNNLLTSIIQSLEDGLNKQIKSYKQSLVESQQIPADYGRDVEYMLTIPESWSDYTINNFNTDYIFNINGDKTNDTTESIKNDEVNPNKEELSNPKDSSSNVDNNDKNAPQKSADEKDIIRPKPEYSNVDENINSENNTSKTETSEVKEHKTPKTYLNTSTNVSITEILQTILKNCVELKKRYSEAVSNNKVSLDNIKTHKVVTSITSDANKFIIHYDIIEVEDKPPELKNKDVIDRNAIEESIKDEFSYVYEYDYIFSGLNIDVLGFDMTLNDATLYISRSPIDNLHLNKERIGGETNTTIDKPKSEFKKVDNNNAVYLRKNDPISIPKNFTGDYKTGNLDNYYINSGTEKNDFFRIMSFISGIDNSSNSCILTIIGNPDILGACSKMIKSCDRGIYLSELRQEESDILSDKKNNALIRVPLLVKVNVYYTTPYGTQAKFWYDDYYIVKQITNRFSNGQFTQELHMITFTMDGSTAGKTNTEFLPERIEKYERSELSSEKVVENNYDVVNNLSSSPKFIDWEK